MFVHGDLCPQHIYEHMCVKHTWKYTRYMLLHIMSFIRFTVCMLGHLEVASGLDVAHRPPIEQMHSHPTGIQLTLNKELRY